MAIALRYAARTDLGLGRYTENQDSGYAGPHLLVVADGMGGHAGGDVASSVTVGRLVALDGDSVGGDALSRLAEVLREANAELRSRVADEPRLQGMGTTVSALLRYGNRFAVAHIGDSRGYLLRGGELAQITHDHSFVQTLVDEGRISAEDAESHPQKNIVTRVLTGSREDEPDLSVREARVGDRYLLCSDGLTDVVRADTILTVLTEHTDPAAAAERLIELALRSGGQDNITCVVADVVEVEHAEAIPPQVVGAAAEHGTVHQPSDEAPETAALATPAAKAAALTREARRADADEDDEHDAVAGSAGHDSQRGSGHHWRRGLGALLVLAVLGGGSYAAYTWSQRQYFVGADSGDVAIYRGLPQDVGPLGLSSVYERPGLRLADLPAYPREQVQSKITADDLSDARAKVQRLRQQSTPCVQARRTPAPAPSATASPTTAPAAGATPVRTPATAAPTPAGATATTAPTAVPTPAPTASPTASLPPGCEASA